MPASAGPQQSAIHLVLAKPVPASWPETIAVGVRVVVERAVTIVPPRLMLPAGVLATDRHHQFLVRCTDGTAGFEVTDVVLEGAQAPPGNDWRALVAPLRGRDIDFAGLEALRAAIERGYHDAGWRLARVRIPAQATEGGVIRMVLVDPRLGQVRVTGGAPADAAAAFRQAQRHWNGLGPGPAVLPGFDTWRDLQHAWRARLLTQDDLTTQLLALVTARQGQP
mgnify:CR=1 FL=1